jgi:predicted MPP superfamily phosphohydrolase
MHPVAKAAAGVTLAGAATLAYSSGYEVRAYRLRRTEVPVLAPGARPLRVLHISDLHFTPRQRSKVAWLRALATLQPDLVVNTGDNLSHVDAVPVVLDALGPLLDFPGVFVFGSNDYSGPILRNPLRYLIERDRPGGFERGVAVPLPTEDLRRGLRDAGWLDLNNAAGWLPLDDRQVQFVGVDDPHVARDDYRTVGHPPDADADASIAVVHAPYRRVLSAMAADGWPLLLAGHTHGGQVCIPGYGALVTNCDLDTARVKGLSRFDGSYLHVSAGLGTSRFAPVRLACFPEASLLTLVAAR